MGYDYPIQNILRYLEGSVIISYISILVGSFNVCVCDCVSTLPHLQFDENDFLEKVSSQDFSKPQQAKVNILLVKIVSVSFSHTTNTQRALVTHGHCA